MFENQSEESTVAKIKLLKTAFELDSPGADEFSELVSDLSSEEIDILKKAHQIVDAT